MIRLSGGTLLVLSVLFACFMAGPSPLLTWAAQSKSSRSFKQSSQSFKIGVVDPQEVLERSRAGRHTLAQLRQYASARQRILNNDQQELQKLEQELKASDSKLTSEQKQAKQTQFQSKVQNYQQRLQQFNQEIAAKQKEMVEEYTKKISSATKAVAERKGFTLILDKGSENTLKIVIYNNDDLDLTDEVITEFDRLYKQ